MSNDKFKLHPASIFVAIAKTLKDLLVPIVIIFVANGFKLNLDYKSDTFFKDSFSLILFIIVIGYILINNILKWWTYRYWFEDSELRVEYGLFVKKKRFIPFDRIQNLNYKESILHRLFGLVQVTIETAGSKTGKPEAVLTAITKNAATQIELEMKASSQQTTETITEEQKIIHKMSMRDLLIVATTSNSISVVLLGAVALVSQFAEFIPFEMIFDELAHLVRYGFILIALLVVVGLFIVWLISVLMTALNYYQFTVVQDGEKLIITRGLLEKKRITLPIKRVQAIKVVENPFRQLFGLATVVVESAGGDFSEQSDRKIVLLPIISRKQLKPTVEKIFPSYHFDESQLISSPTRARAFFYRLDFVYTIPVIATCTYFFYPYGLFSLLLVVVMLLLGIWQHRTAAYNVSEQQLLIRYRRISRITFYAQKSKIQMLEKRQSYFQKRKQLATAQIVVMSGVEGAKAKAYHMEEHEVEQLLQWYETKKTTGTDL